MYSMYVYFYITITSIFSGWLYKATLSNPNELESLMNEEGYNEYLKTCD